LLTVQVIYDTPIQHQILDNGLTMPYYRIPDTQSQAGGQTPTMRFMSRRQTAVPLILITLIALSVGQSQMVVAWLGFDLPRSAAAADLIIYYDALATDWQDWSWDTTVNLAATAPVQTGSRSISAQYTAAWGALSLRAPTAIDTANYTAIDFWLYGGSGGTAIEVYTQPSDEGEYSAPAAITGPAGVWTHISIPLSDLGGPAAIQRMDFKDPTGGAQPAFYIDNLRLLAKQEAGGPFPDSTADAARTGLDHPAGIAIAPNGRLFVAIWGNDGNDGNAYRQGAVWSWPNAAALLAGNAPDVVLGQSGAAQISNPEAVAVDSSNRLYVADTYKHRVLVYNSVTTTGQQPNFIFGSQGNSSALENKFQFTRGMAVDGQNHLFVTDTFNNRVLVYNLPIASNNPTPIAQFSGLSGPRAVAARGTDVYIADSQNGVVRVFLDPVTSANYTTPDRTLGDSHFSDCSSSGANTSATYLSCPIDVAVDPGGNLVAADTPNHRVLGYLAGAFVPTVVFGQANFTSFQANRGGAVGMNTLSSPLGMTFDSSGNLFVADFANGRVLRFDGPVAPATATPTATHTPTRTPTSTATPTRTATPTTVPAGADSFEIDNTCVQAKSISVGGGAQSHTFHVGNDVDWVRFTAQANKTYIIQVENVGAKADAVLFLHDTCASDPTTSGNNAFGSTVRLEWDSVKNDDYFIRLQQFDSTFFGADANYTISVSVDNVPPSEPSDLTCVSIDATTVGVQWRKSPERDVRKYRISYKNSSGTFSGSSTVNGAETTYYELKGLTTGVEYTFSVRSLDFSNNPSPESGEVKCIAQTPADITQPTLIIQQPTSSTVYTTTAEKITLSGLASDTGGNLSRVQVQNLTKGGEKWDYSLSDSNDTWRVEDIALGSGDNNLRIRVHDTAGNTGIRDLLVKRLGNSPGAVIIIAGHNETFGLQTNIYNSTNRAYRIFKSAGFTDEDIFYLAPVAQDADKDGVANEVDVTASPAAFQQAITVWAKTKVDADKPLFIYMMDHGLADRFCITGCAGANSITPDEMDGWLTTLENESGVTAVTVVYEACVSGSFIHHQGGGVGDSISKPGRVIITSTGFNNNAYASAQGAYFSDAFFSCVADSGNLKACFDQGKAAVTTTGVNQTPFLDDNGDGVYNPAGDGSVAINRHVTRFFSSVRPVIASVDVQKSGANGVLSATVTEGAEQTELVWAAIYGPSFQEPADVTINLNVPALKLEPVAGQPGKFSVNYTNGFVEPGDYRIVFYAQDRLGLNAAPVSPGQEQLFLPYINR